jgi:hypothetical protein
MTYPAGIAALTVKTDGPDQPILAAHPNALKTALDEFRAVIGDTPQGALSDLQTRLAVLLGTDGNLKSQTGILFVGKSGCQYTDIQTAHDAASAGDVIYVLPGTYSEVLTLSKALVICGIVGGNGSNSKVILSGAITMTADVQINNVNVAANLTYALGATACELENVLLTTGNLYLSTNVILTVHRSNLSRNAILTGNSSLRCYYSALRISSIEEGSSVYAYWCSYVSLPLGTKNVFWCSGGAIAVDATSVICGSCVSSFSGSGGAGSYNFKSDGSAISVP